MKSLVVRHLQVFFRDKSNLFFALLSSLIMFVLYMFFLGSIQSENLKAVVVSASDDSIQQFVNAWVFSGIITITAVTTSLGAFNVFVEDRVQGRLNDFAVSPLPKWKLVMSHMLSAIVISTLLTTVVALGSALYVSFTGGAFMGMRDGIILLATVLFLSVVFSSMAAALATTIKSTSAFTSVGVIVGTSVGFLAGVYVPVGSLPNGVANTISALPFSQATALVRDTFATGNLNNLSSDTNVIETLRSTYGFSVTIGGTHLDNHSIVFILVSVAVALLIVSIIRARNVLKSS